MVGSITPPSSNANTPLRAPLSPSPERAATSPAQMDVDGPSADGSPSPGADDDDVLASSGTEIEEEELEDAPKEGSKKPAAKTARAFRPKEKDLHDSDVVERWNKAFGDPFLPKSGAPTPSA
ncbi:hypothetical protein Q8F55_009059 [Vanrija albida]|uniref:Uncharacterized protein n=1 Tax=Vanrija albida TaxID=181172 RepID=A0ABR3PSL0_9TREE